MHWFLRNFLLTLALEGPIWWLGLRRFPWWQVALFIVLVNGFTLPLGTVAFYDLELPYFAVEGAIALVEGLITLAIWGGVPWKALLLAVLANGFSMGMGLLFQHLGWL